MKVPWTAVRYGLVSVLCAVLYNAIMIVGDRLGAHYALSYALAFVVILVISFALHSKFTLRAEPTPLSFIRYALALAVNAPLNLILFFVLCDVLGLPMEIAAPMVTVLLIIWNYLAARWALARRAPDVQRSSSTTSPDRI